MIFREDDVTSILEVMEACSFCAKDDYFKVILSKLSAIFSSELSLCAISEPGSLLPGALVMNGFSQDFLEVYLSKKPSCRDALVNHIMATEGAALFRVGDAPLDTDVRAVNSAQGIDTCIAGTFCDCDLRTMFLCIPNPGKSPMGGQLDLLRLAFPHLHHAMTKLATRMNSKPHLSVREREVLEWVTGGKTNWEISKILDVTEDTVKFHLKNIYRKLNASNKAHAITKAFQLGIVRSMGDGVGPR